ncbi:MAG: phospho-N-acetylmuramoyl-pentapeptide-transferase [Akkermansia sp.]|nr:phospho-N-acetylmuramoyl-pentapeptide-transferase [Akkermansia sp.]MBR1978435.1 phospho-N-acetylmuramoyl-pentapeptide-transferase [Akkermansia sp.]
MEIGTQCLLALLIPFVGSLLIGPKLIAVLRAMKAGQPIREARKGVLAPEHQSKVGTPTMGGIMLIGLVLLTTLLVADLSNVYVQCCLIVTSITAFLGFLDDYAKITKKSTDGVSGWFKIGLQFVAALGCSVYLYLACPQVTYMMVPFYGVLDIGVFFIPLALLVIIGTSNAVNLTDGLDGLASGCMIIAALFYCFLISVVSFMNPCGYLIPFLLTIISACVGFLWFNCNPARVFMGDTGSLALGGALGTVAVCSGTELLLVIVGGVFVVEALSVMIQVFWFKYTRIKYGEGRRIFRMAPIHHHFEKGGLSETQVCVRFWIVAAILGACAVYAQMSCF